MKLFKLHGSSGAANLGLPQTKNAVSGESLVFAKRSAVDCC